MNIFSKVQLQNYWRYENVENIATSWPVRVIIHLQTIFWSRIYFCKGICSTAFQAQRHHRTSRWRDLWHVKRKAENLKIHAVCWNYCEIVYHMSVATQMVENEISLSRTANRLWACRKSCVNLNFRECVAKIVRTFQTKINFILSRGTIHFLTR